MRKDCPSAYPSMSTFLFFRNPAIEKPQPQKHIDQNIFEILHTIWILTEPCFVKKLSRFASKGVVYGTYMA